MPGAKPPSHGDALYPISDTQAASKISSILHPSVGDPAKGYPLRNMDMGEVFELAARQAAEKHPRDNTRASEESEESDSGEEMEEDVVQPSSSPRNRAMRG